MENKSRKIGENTYTITLLGGKKGTAALSRITRLTQGGLGGLMAKLTEDDVEYFCDTFAPLTVVKKPDGREPHLNHIFDDHFSGNYGELMNWLFFCMEANFSSFFLGLPEINEAMGAWATDLAAKMKAGK